MDTRKIPKEKQDKLVDKAKRKGIEKYKQYVIQKKLEQKIFTKLSNKNIV